MAAISLVFGLVGTLVQAAGAAAAGKEERKMQEYNAALLDRKAGQERAMASYRMQEQARKTKQLQSEGLARAAASGGGVLGSFEDIVEGNERRSAFLEGFERHQGEERAKGNEADASVKRMAGAAAERAGRIKSAGIVLSGLTKISGGGGFDGFGSSGSSGSSYDDWGA
jgi:hypothetical protein